MTRAPVHIRPAERFLARVIVVLFVSGVAAAVLPAVADPVSSAIAGLAPDDTAEDTEPSPGPIMIPEGAPQTAPSAPASTGAPEPTQAPPEVEAAIAEAPATTTAPPTTAPPTTTTTAVPGSIPPAAGTYPYRLRYVDDEETLEANGRIVVQAARQAEGETRQTHVFTDEVYGTHSEAYAWRSDGVFLRVVDDGSGAEGNSCDFEPDILVYPLPLTVGHSWKLDSACANDAEADRYEASSKVERAERTAIAGREVDVFVIRTLRLWAEDGGFVNSVELVSFAPSLGLAVKGSTSYSFHEGGETTAKWREEFELQTLDPQ